MTNWLICFLFCFSPVMAQEVSAPYARVKGAVEAPTGDKDMSFVRNYVRITPNIGAGGRLSPDGVERAMASGFKLIIDLRQPHETGVAEEEAAAIELGVRYIRMPMPAEAGALEAYLPLLITELEKPENYPILLHCGSGNRVGAAWALYRESKGVPAIIALEEGRAAGMTEREAFVRKKLGL